MHRRFVLLVATTLIGLLAGCGQPPTSQHTAVVPTLTPTTAPPATPISTPTAEASSAPPSASVLEDALAVVPRDVHSIFLTNWKLIKDYQGVPNLTSEQPLEERQEFMIALSENQAVASGFGVNRFATHAEVWGWDSTDLDWELSTSSDASPVFVLKFRQDFDFAPVLARFTEREFTASTHQGTTIYSHPMDIKATWLRATEFSILNTAVLPDKGMFVLSSSLDQVTATLDSMAQSSESLADLDAARLTAQTLGDVAAAFLAVGADTCGGFGLDPITSERLTDEQRQALQQQFAGRALLPYDALGVAYRYDGDTPVGVVVMQYADADAAEQSVEARQNLIEQGVSLRAAQPFSEVVAALADTTLVDGTLTFRLNPAQDQPRRLFEMILGRDMLFAACAVA